MCTEMIISVTVTECDVAYCVITHQSKKKQRWCSHLNLKECRMKALMMNHQVKTRKKNSLVELVWCL